MIRSVVAARIFDNGTVRDTLSKEISALRKQGFSIFGINEYNKIPGSMGIRWVKIFYE